MDIVLALAHLPFNEMITMKLKYRNREKMTELKAFEVWWGRETTWSKGRQSNERTMQGAFGGGHRAASFTQGTRVLLGTRY